MRAEVWRIGGRHAQCDIVDWILTIAPLRGGQKPRPQGLAHEQLASRPASLINRRFQGEAEKIAA